MTAKRENTPERIECLKENEVFVFGSNKAGKHIGGAAELAYKKFGAEWGVSLGVTGQSYAIPTLDENFQRLDLREITDSLIELYEDAEELYPEMKFYVTKLGLGIAGYEVEEIRECFHDAKSLNGSVPINVIIPKEFE